VSRGQRDGSLGRVLSFLDRRRATFLSRSEVLNEELHNLYYSLSTITVIKSRRMRLAGHVTRMGRRVMQVGYKWEMQKAKDH
jgi:hypothetical protein